MVSKTVDKHTFILLNTYHYLRMQKNYTQTEIKSLLITQSFVQFGNRTLQRHQLKSLTNYYTRFHIFGIGRGIKLPARYALDLGAKSRCTISALHKRKPGVTGETGVVATRGFQGSPFQGVRGPPAAGTCDGMRFLVDSNLTYPRWYPGDISTAKTRPYLLYFLQI